MPERLRASMTAAAFCDVFQQLRQGSPAVESMKPSNAARNALRSLLMKSDAFSP